MCFHRRRLASRASAHRKPLALKSKLAKCLGSCPLSTPAKASRTAQLERAVHTRTGLHDSFRVGYFPQAWLAADRRCGALAVSRTTRVSCLAGPESQV